MTRLVEVLTSGLRKALAKGDLHYECPGCGFPMPKYPGRYPSKCPQCGEPRKQDGEQAAAD